ncbi:MAG TPA: hypothetical protein VK203_28200 [Nostocaceae cyanobacterium]|nr:hypothetical protein [Nostocaceae cyanobacterium]
MSEPIMLTPILPSDRLRATHTPSTHLDKYDDYYIYIDVALAVVVAIVEPIIVISIPYYISNHLLRAKKKSKNFFEK